MASLLINIDVPNVDEAIAFYTTAFELRLSRRFDGGFAELTGAEVAVFLLENSAGTPPFLDALVVREYNRHWTPVHLDFVVPDLDAALTRALAAGARQECAPSEQAYGRLAVLVDPFGHGVCLLEFNDRGYAALTAESPIGT